MAFKKGTRGTCFISIWLREKFAAAAWLATGALLVLLSAGLPLTFAYPAGDRTADLEALVNKLITLQKEAHEEETRWQEQKVHLQTTLSLLRKEHGQLEVTLASLAKQEAGLEETEESLSLRRDKTAALLMSINESVSRAAAMLLETCEKLPEPMQAVLKPEAARLRDMMAAEPDRWKAAGNLQQTFKFAADLHRILNSIQVLKQILNLPGTGRQEVDVLYLGGAIGYYRSPDGSRAGILAREKEGWRPVPRDDLAATVTGVIEIFRKESPPALIDLPILIREQP